MVGRFKLFSRLTAGFVIFVSLVASVFEPVRQKSLMVGSYKMGCFIAGCAGALLGRLGVFLLWFAGWFGRADIGFIWALVGFLFAPLTLICVGCVNIYFGGEWGLWQIVALVFCLMSDLGSEGGAASKRRRT